MAISIDKTLPNGVPLSYYRIVSVNILVNNQCIIELAGYVSEEARKAEQDAASEASESGQYPFTDIYIDTQYIIVDYDPEMSVSKAYALLKEMEEFEGAEDVIDQWAVGMSYYTGDMVVYEDKQYECIQPHVSQEGYEPDMNPALWSLYEEGDDGIPVWSQPDSTNPYMTGDRVHFPDADGPVYESDVDNNVWAPDVYGWSLVEGGE